MQLEYKTDKVKVLFVKVPDDSFAHWLNPTLNNHLHYHTPQLEGMRDIDVHTLKLPYNDCQLIGLTSEITEEWLKDVGFGNTDYIEDGLGPTDSFVYKLDSFKSLMQYLQVYEVNPYGPQPGLRDEDAGSVEETENRFLRADAQSRTGKWIVLFKPN